MTTDAKLHSIGRFTDRSADCGPENSELGMRQAHTLELWPERRLLAAPLIVLSLFCTVVAFGQESDPPGDDGEAAVELTGDVITLTSGKILSGVQVVRRSPRGFEVEIVEGVPTLLIPRNQVKSIEYDDIEPLRERRRELMRSRRRERLESSGKRITPELREKLRRVIPDPPPQYEADLIEILKDLANRLEVHLEIHQSVKDLRPGSRHWQLKIAEDKTLMSILESDFLKRFEQLRVDYDLDTIVIITKEAAEKNSRQAAPPARPPASPPARGPAPQ